MTTETPKSITQMIWERMKYCSREQREEACFFNVAAYFPKGYLALAVEVCRW